MVIFLSACVEGIIRLFTNFYLQRKLLIFLRKYHDSKAVALKEYYNYSPVSTYTESCQYFQEMIVIVKMLIYRK